jgi:hypothetical protein
VVKALDAPDMDKLADRLRPPDVQAEQDDEGGPDPQQMQQFIALGAGVSIPHALRPVEITTDPSAAAATATAGAAGVDACSDQSPSDAPCELIALRCRRNMRCADAYMRDAEDFAPHLFEYRV